jgi:hypothetical protein
LSTLQDKYAVTLFLLGLFVVLAVIALVAFAHSGPEPIDSQRVWTEQVLASCAKRKADNVSRLTRSLIGNPVSFRGDGNPEHEIPEGTYSLSEDPERKP